VVLVDGIQTLVDIIKVDSIRIDLVLLIVLSCGVVVTIAIQAKDGLYRN
jgi:hypothetical protein